MFLPSTLHTSSGSDQKVPAPTGSVSATLLLRNTGGQPKQSVFFLMRYEQEIFYSEYGPGRMVIYT